MVLSRIMVRRRATAAAVWKMELKMSGAGKGEGGERVMSRCYFVGWQCGQAAMDGQTAGRGEQVRQR
jgi:hypothetical protein